MAKIVVAPYGSLGDLHPLLALAIELRDRGHKVSIATLDVYQEKVAALGFEFYCVRPSFDPDDREISKQIMDTRTGSETLVREYILPGLPDMYEDLLTACKGSDLLISGEVVYAARSVVEITGLNWVTTTLAPLSLFSTYEPNVFPNNLLLSRLNFLGRPFQMFAGFVMRRIIDGWLDSYREFRRSLGLSEDHDPIIDGKYSDDLHLAMFSKVLGEPKPDWKTGTVQTGFCFYDGRDDLGKMPGELIEFLNDGEPPIVFTLGSAAVMDARDFFEQSIGAAKMLGRRAVMLYGVFNEPPVGLDRDRVGFDYAPYSKLFPRAACVVHQGGVGTTAQVLRAGVPQLIMPFSHDQPDNAARCERLGVASQIGRDRYNSGTAAGKIAELLDDETIKAKAQEVKDIIGSEHGATTACDAIENLLEEK